MAIRFCRIVGFGEETAMAAAIFGNFAICVSFANDQRVEFSLQRGCNVNSTQTLNLQAVILTRGGLCQIHRWIVLGGLFEEFLFIVDDKKQLRKKMENLDQSKRIGVMTIEHY